MLVCICAISRQLSEGEIIIIKRKKLQMIFVGVLLLPNWRWEHAAAGQPSRTVSRERHADRDEEDVEQKPVYVTVRSQAEAVALTWKS